MHFPSWGNRESLDTHPGHLQRSLPKWLIISCFCSFRGVFFCSMIATLPFKLTLLIVACGLIASNLAHVAVLRSQPYYSGRYRCELRSFRICVSNIQVSSYENDGIVKENSQASTSRLRIQVMSCMRA